MFEKVENRILRWIRADRYLPLQIDITNACNLRCSHCYHPHHRNEGALQLEDWCAILDEYQGLTARLGYRPSVTICGGEPLASGLLEPILDQLRGFERPSRVSILTNGTLARQKVVAGWEAGLESLSFQVSLDGPDIARHDRIRGAGSFEKAVDGARHLMALRYPVHFLAVLSKQSATWIPDFFETAAQVGVPHLAFTRLIQRGAREQMLVGTALRDAYRTILTQSALHGVSSTHQSPLFHLLHPALGRSGRFWEGLVVDYQGHLLASSRSRLRLGDVRVQGLGRLYLEHPHFRRLRRGEIAGCGGCQDFRKCGGDRNAAWAATGDFFARDPACWIQETQMKEANS